MVFKVRIKQYQIIKLNCENVLFQSLFIDGSIDMVKTKIKDFCDLYAGKDKI